MLHPPVLSCIACSLGEAQRYQSHFEADCATDGLLPD